MITFLTILHVIVAILMVISILMQAGKGGGLAEGFNSAESLLGAQTNVVMVRITAVLGIIFLCTSLGLAVLTARQQGSLMGRMMPQQHKAKTVDVDKLFDQTPAQTITLNAEMPANTTK